MVYFQGVKFFAYIDNQRETCEEEFQIGENVQGHGQEVCEENCSFYSNNGWCNLYSTCESTRVTKQSGTTFEKKGNCIMSFCLFVSDDMNSNNYFLSCYYIRIHSNIR